MPPKGLGFIKVLGLCHIGFVVTFTTSPSKSRCRCADNSLAFGPRDVSHYQKKQPPCLCQWAGN